MMALEKYHKKLLLYRKNVKKEAWLKKYKTKNALLNNFTESML